jgi:cellulose biosynthesis protein BcsQ
MSRILALYQIKGGVGKTATAVNLAYLAAAEGYRTLLWDLDPQGATSFYYRVRPKVKGGGRKLILRKRALDEIIKGTDYGGLDLIPADFSYRNLDLHLADTRNPHARLRKLLKPVARDYDLILLDCAPGITLISEAVFHAVDALVVPLIPTTLSVRTYHQLQDHLAAHGLRRLPRRPFFSMVDRRRGMHRALVDTLTREIPEILPIEIPYSAEVERMGTRRAPVCEFAPRSPVTDAYRRLLQAVMA